MKLLIVPLLIATLTGCSAFEEKIIEIVKNIKKIKAILLKEIFKFDF